ncbi:MAG TPA: glycoside hydrolase family 31 protein [Phycisphaerae bacterium]|nr:glycoside hydrolase family 31 protein [Phycisphaerae bacterium]
MLVIASMLLAAPALWGAPATPQPALTPSLEPRAGTIALPRSASERDEQPLVSLAAVLLDGVAQAGYVEAPPAADGRLVFSNDALRVSLEALSAEAAAVRWTALDGELHDFVIPVQDNSAYYGAGERFTSLNHKGHILPMVSIDHPEDKGAVTYKPVPFYMSTRGYAVWLDTFAPSTFDFNATDRAHVRLHCRAKELRLVLIAGPDFTALLDTFTLLTGRPRVPPLWSFAPWKSRDVHRNSADLLADAELTRRHDLPGSVIVIDSPWETGYNDFTLNEQQFTDPETVFQRIAALGFYPCFWLTPFVNVENVTDMTGIDPGPARNFAEARDRGFLVRRPDGEPMIAAWWKGRGGLVDFTNPAATAWWHDQIDLARRWGLHGLKCDDGEGNFVQDAVFFDGTPAAEMKNRYAALYLQAAQSYIDERLDGDGVLVGRCGYTGAQQQPFGWAGDNAADFSFANGLPTVILAAQNAALSGLPWWGSDIAGYMGTPTKELFIRWTQFGALSPLMLVHMQSNLGPWDFDAQTLEIYRTFAKLHTSLAPYLLDAAHAAHYRGLPIVRPMVLAFPNDPQAAPHRYQYLLGPDLLVAPMYQPGTHRCVYLPKQPGQSDGGVWIDFWTHATHPGGRTIEVHAPLERTPLFVRAGAILCRLPDDVDTLIPRTPQMSADVVAIDDRRVIEVWPGPDNTLQTAEGITATTGTDADGRNVRLQSATPRRLLVRVLAESAETPGQEERITAGQEPVTLRP